MFTLSPAMLLIDTNVWEVILICVTSLVGMFAVSAGMEGYIFHHMSWPQRLISTLGGLMLIDPGLVTDILGLVLVGLVLVMQVITKRSASTAAAGAK